MGKKVEVPDEIYERLKERSKEKGFDSCEAYINDILKQVKEKLERKEKKEEEDNNEKEFSEEDEEKVRKRLKALGYL